MKDSLRSAAAVVTVGLLSGAAGAAVAHGSDPTVVAAPSTTTGPEGTLPDAAVTDGTLLALRADAVDLERRLVRARAVVARQERTLRQRRAAARAAQQAAVRAATAASGPVAHVGSPPAFHVTTRASGTGPPATHITTRASGGHGDGSREHEHEHEGGDDD